MIACLVGELVSMEVKLTCDDIFIPASLCWRSLIRQIGRDNQFLQESKHFLLSLCTDLLSETILGDLNRLKHFRTRN